MTKQGWLIFDFDGVIVDSFDAAFKLSQHLLKVKDEAAYRALFRHRIASALKKKLSPRSITRLLQKFGQALTGQPIVPGMVELIPVVGKKYNLAIVSSTPTDAIKNFLTHYDLEKYFTEILGYDVETNKAKKITQLFETYQFSSQECMMITDTTGDIEEARQVGVKTIGVTWGYHAEKTLSAAQPFALARTPLELLKIINLFFS